MHAYLTAKLPGIGGVIKEMAEDFVVTEIPLYLPCGEGEHAYVEIEKSGVTTLDAIRRIARSLGISERDIGYAGLKDSRGITRQTLSIPRVETDRLLALSLQGITILSANRHRNKLKLGHLAGNSFTIRVRSVESDALKKATAILAVLTKRGVPNYFGSQRYGGLGNSHLIGRALVRRDFKGAIDAIMGDPAMVRDEHWRQAVETYHRGDLAGSLEHFPGHCRTEREVLQRLIKRPEAFERALDAVSPRLKKLYLSAYQSSLFDRVLEQRLNSLDMVEEGDLAYLHVNGACFLVENSSAEETRAQAFEISPTGPMFGCKMKLPEGKPREAEEKVLQGESLTLADFNLPGGLRMEGERRPLRVPIQNLSTTMDADGLTLNFSLPRGVYATTVLREIMKSKDS
ncbi:MAG: tRNA pseudouridine(13) synthase TruD [Syntrophobacterales bacterium]|nr:MAG: tRNA pseudouridine(13) synthase TruD [Syntrophobacterales bacterium]